MVGKKFWKGEEEVKLSKLLLTFWQRHGRLPSGAQVSGFSKTVKDRLEHRFTIKQIQRKVVTLRKRYLNIIRGTARELKKHEAEIVPIWGKMMNHAEEAEEEVDEEDEALPVGRRGNNTAEDLKEHIHLERATRDVKEEVDQRGQADSHNLNENATYEAQAARWENLTSAAENDNSSSCCVLEEENDPEEVEEVEEGQEDQFLGEGEEQYRPQAWEPPIEEAEEEAVEEAVEEEEDEEVPDAAAQHEAAAHNKYHGFHQDQRLRVLNCLAIADLASAVKTLAEVVRARRPQPIPV